MCILHPIYSSCFKISKYTGQPLATTIFTWCPFSDVSLSTRDGFHLLPQLGNFHWSFKSQLKCHLLRETFHDLKALTLFPSRIWCLAPPKCVQLPPYNLLTDYKLPELRNWSYLDFYVQLTAENLEHRWMKILFNQAWWKQKKKKGF